MDSYNLWIDYLPYIKPYYAVKCNPDQEIIYTLASLGCGFDCASSSEIDAAILATNPENIIFANPCKTSSYIEHAKICNVSVATFDTICELEKIHKIYPEMKLILRIYACDSDAQCILSDKYGAIQEEWKPILQRASELSMNVIGISFHIGSGASNPRAFTTAIANSRKLYDIGKTYGFNMNLIDIGGGFSQKNFAAMSKSINEAILKYFPGDLNFSFIAEPGRFFAENVATLLTKIINVRERKGVREYWLSDGLYGSFNCILYDHISLNPTVLNKTQIKEKTKAVLWGPTCDGFDKIVENIELPIADIDDWLIWNNMGAYTIAGACNFNGINGAEPDKIYFISRSVNLQVLSCI